MGRNKSPQTELREIAKHLPITDYLEYRQFLLDLYSKRKSQAESYSYQRFNQDLQLGTSNFFQLVINGTRKLAVDSAKKISNVLGLKNNARLYFLALVKHADTSDPAERDRAFAKMMELRSKETKSLKELDCQRLLSEWLNCVVLEATRLDGFRLDAEWVQKKLRFPARLDAIRESLDFLSATGFIVYDSSKGKYVSAAEEHIKGSDVISNISQICYLQNMIKLGHDAVTRIGKKERDVSGITVTLDENLLEEVQGDLRRLMEKVRRMSEQRRGKRQVFQLNIQFFPFTQ